MELLTKISVIYFLLNIYLNREFVEAQEERGRFQILPPSLRNYFYPTTSKPSAEVEAKESGNLDSPARDFLRGLSNTVDKIEDRIGSRSSKGLDSDSGDRTFFGGVADKFKERVRAIYPGTKWCGDGNRSVSFDDLGRHQLTDKCCRQHDLCGNNIDAGKAYGRLLNTGLFTRSHCDCDNNFYQCLKKANTRVSTRIGYTYFTVLGPQCFKEDYPVVNCKQRDRRRCVNYELDQNKEKTYQWFDNPRF